MSYAEAMHGPLGPGWKGHHHLSGLVPFLLLGAAAAGARAQAHDHGGHPGRGRGRGRGPRGSRGEFPFGPPGFPGFPGFPPGGRLRDAYRGRGPRVRRGDVRAGILALLAEEPRNGYQIIQELGARSDGVWRPSPGSVYPALQQLEDEGLVRTVEAGGRKAFELTDDGRAYVEEHADEVRAPWEAVSGSVHHGVHELGALGAQVGAAAMQVVHAGNDEQLEQAKQVLVEARRALYRILAEDGQGPESDTDA